MSTLVYLPLLVPVLAAAAAIRAAASSARRSMPRSSVSLPAMRSGPAPDRRS